MENAGKRTGGPEVPLIPREVLFGNPEKIGPSLSPDGRDLAYLAPDERNVLQVWLRSPGQQDDRKLTNDEKRGIYSYFWTYDGRHMVYEQDSDGDENYHLYAVDIASGSVRDLTPFPGARAMRIARSPERPGEILVGINARDLSVFDVYRVDLATGAAELMVENPGQVNAWWADAELAVRAALLACDDGGFDLMVRPAAEADWRTLRHWGPDEEGSPIGFSKDGRTLYLKSNHDANTLRLVAVDLDSGQERVLAEDPQYDLETVLRHPVERTVQAAGFCRDKLGWQVLDQAVAGDFDFLLGVRDGELRILSRDLADTTWVVGYTTDDGPVYYYTYDRQARQARPLFTSNSKLESLPLAKMQPVTYTARDGLTIHAYLTLPPGAEPKNLPTVLRAHGGPWWRYAWGYDAVGQWLANRGYAVLQVNYRGSTGYGKDFLNAGNREWAGKMHDDLIDGVEWLKARGIADPDRIAIMGGSYGGYATLVGLTFTPDVFACGVDIVGPSSLITLLRTVPPYWKTRMKVWAHRLGDVEKDEAFLKSRSPLYFAHRIKKPLLIGQGANDPRVKQAESDQIVAAMRKANIPVEYIVYTDEGHGFVRPENRIHFFARAEQFLAKHLGGRAEPVGEIPGHCGEDR